MMKIFVIFFMVMLVLVVVEFMLVLCQKKFDFWFVQSEVGVFDINCYVVQVVIFCVNGKVGEYQCKNVDLVLFLCYQDMGFSICCGNDVWGMYFF